MPNCHVYYTTTVKFYFEIDIRIILLGSHNKMHLAKLRLA